MATSPQHQCLTCQRIRKKRCPGITNNTGSCDECRRLHLECLHPELRPFGRPFWFHDKPKLAECRDQIKDWTSSRRPREGHEMLHLSEVLSPPSLASSAHAGHVMGSLSGQGSIQYNQGPSTTPQHEVSQTIPLVLSTVSFLVNTHLPQVRELVLILDEEDEDDEGEFQVAIEALSQAGRLGSLSFNVRRGH